MLRPLRTLRTYRRLKRYREVTFILVKYGFEDITNRIGGAFSWRRLRGWRTTSADSPTPQRLRMALEELGPTFIKFGQLLSTRPDVLPDEYIVELEKLQDEVPPFPVEEVRSIFREELGKDPEELFRSFDSKVVASGSIAQVHHAVLKTGAEVAVKVQRPHIGRVIETDLEILQELTALIERHMPELRWLRPGELVDQFASTIRRELDFISEAQVMERFRKNFEDDPHRVIPAVHWDYCSMRILTADFVRGIKINRMEELKAGDYDQKALAREGARSILKEVFEFRLFHADPHPGNFFVLPDNSIATVDFGIVGRLDNATADQLGLLLYSIVSRDVEQTIKVFKNLGLLDEVADLTMLRFDLEEFLDRYHGLPLDRLDAERVIEDLLRIVRRHRVILPVNLALLGRMLAVAAGVGRMLDPDFDIVAEARPFVRRFMSQRLDPRTRMRDLARTLADYQAMLREFPSDLEEILAKVKKGQMLVSIHHEGLNRFILEMDRSSNRVTFGLIVASLVVGSSLVMQLEKGPTLFGFPALGLAGYIIAGILGLWLVLAILRSGRI